MRLLNLAVRRLPGIRLGPLVFLVALSAQSCRVAPTPNPSLQAQLVAVEASGPTGTATIQDIGEGRLQAFVELSVPSANPLALAIQRGSCQVPGDLVAALAEPDAGKSWTTVTGRLDDFLGLIVTVRSQGSRDLLACGDLASVT
jgi:hypothetical protein